VLCSGLAAGILTAAALRSPGGDLGRGSAAAIHRLVAINGAPRPLGFIAAASL